MSTDLEHEQWLRRQIATIYEHHRRAAASEAKEYERELLDILNRRRPTLFWIDDPRYLNPEPERPHGF